MKLARCPDYSNIAMYLLIHLGATICFLVKPEMGAIGLAFVLYVVTVGLGWSVGIHRGLIHRSFKTYHWVENGLAMLGALSGLGGPISSSRIHFVRDFSQSRPGIADFGPPRSFWQNYFRSPFFYSFSLEPAPKDSITEQLEQRTFLRWLENRWVLTTAMAALLYIVGGLTYVAWGVFARLAITANMFACFDYFCHSSKWGHQLFRIDGATCEGRNNVLLGLLIFGEGWHNNHHAMPSSPQMGFRRFEIDFGYTMICLLQRIGLAWDMVEPAKALRSNARPLADHDRTVSPATFANHHAVETPEALEVPGANLIPSSDSKLV